jgi:uncharacterized protein DUF4440
VVGKSCCSPVRCLTSSSSPGLCPTIITVLAFPRECSQNREDVGRAGHIKMLVQQDFSFDAGGVRKGRAGLLASLRPDTLKSLGAMSSTLTDARSSGDLGYTFGTFAFPATGSQKPRTGNFMLVWRNVGNQWRIAYDTFADDPKAAPAK